MSQPTTILGINAHHADAAACLLVDGTLVAAAEEERFGRIKHCAGFPTEAVRFCLRRADLPPESLTHVAVNRDPRRSAIAKGLHVMRGRASATAVLDRLRNARSTRGAREQVEAALQVTSSSFEHVPVEHHQAHLASAFFESPFDRAAVVSMDGSGDFRTAMWGRGEGSRIDVKGSIHAPHSLGLFYLAVTQFLGFPRFGDEGKLMGLAAYGEPRHFTDLRGLFRLRARGRFSLDQRFFRVPTGESALTWDHGEPRLGPVYTDRLRELLGDPRAPDEPVSARHMDLAASAQEVFEEVYLHVLRHVADVTGLDAVALAGGCALNGVANGKLQARTGFRELFVPCAPGDAGGAVGAALWTWHQRLGHDVRARPATAFLGPEYGADDVDAVLSAAGNELSALGGRIRRFADPSETTDFVAERIASGAVVGWFQGRMEFGPRALGHRSILADPRRDDMRDRLNARIKMRESFRPFAPAVLRDHATDWFDLDGDVPFMNRVVPVRPDRRDQIPAVTHVDGTARVQTVTEEDDPVTFELIRRFHQRTGVPMVINTSFNENEPDRADTRRGARLLPAHEDGRPRARRRGGDARCLSWDSVDTRAPGESSPNAACDEPSSGASSPGSTSCRATTTPRSPTSGACGASARGGGHAA